ncbi:MAG: lysine--tRNA ligase, partial [Lachnospiraceae bacterium]|nr:lysine--tRNA ligase [Lachnospiraceae bacterium]
MAEEKQQEQTKTEDIGRLVQVRRDKLKELQDAGRDPFEIVRYDQTHHSSEIREKEAELETVLAVNEEGRNIIPAWDTIPEEKRVSIVGRMMSKRVMGKASFCHIQDLEGQMQVYVTRDALGEEAYDAFKKMDIGDILGVKGFVFRTKAGELSVHAEELTLLSKSLQPLPEKYHGLTDTELRYRQRYVDLIMNTDAREVFRKRSRILMEIRRFLDGRHFMEVETPIL